MLCCQHSLRIQLVSSKPNARHKSHTKPSLTPFSCPTSKHLSLRRIRLRQLTLRQLSNRQLRLRQWGLQQQQARLHTRARVCEGADHSQNGGPNIQRRLFSWPLTKDVLHFLAGSKLPGDQVVFAWLHVTTASHFWDCVCCCQDHSDISQNAVVCVWAL